MSNKEAQQQIKELDKVAKRTKSDDLKESIEAKKRQLKSNKPIHK